MHVFVTLGWVLAGAPRIMVISLWEAGQLISTVEGAEAANRRIKNVMKSSSWHTELDVIPKNTKRLVTEPTGSPKYIDLYVALITVNHADCDFVGGFG